MSFQVQVTGEWAGAVGGWRPAVAGTANQSGLPDADASTEDTIEAAQGTLDALVTLLTSDPADGDPRDQAPRFRIVEVQS